MNVDYSEPKNGIKFRVIGVARISTEHQDERSLEDQRAFYEQHLDRKFGAGNYELSVVSSRGSGQILDSSSLSQLSEMVESGVYDLVIAEDLGRISRRIYAIIFCEEAEDSKTRVIAINDCVDTAEPNWKQASIFASFKNESFCKDTSARIKRSLRNRFQQGAIVLEVQYGYMSHVVEIRTEVRDEAAVQAACARLKLPAAIRGRFELYASTEEGLGIQLPEWKYLVVANTHTGQIRLMVHQFTRWIRVLPLDNDASLNLLSSELVVS